MLRSDGRLLVAELSMSRVLSGQEELVLIIANDVTERRQQRENAVSTAPVRLRTGADSAKRRA